MSSGWSGLMLHLQVQTEMAPQRRRPYLHAALGTGGLIAVMGLGDWILRR